MLTFNNIVVYYDSLADSHPGLDYSAELAKANGGRLKIVEMVPDFPWVTRHLLGSYERIIEHITQTKTHGLQELAESLRARGIDVMTKVLTGRTSVAMIREVLADGHDLAVKEAKGEHSRRTGFFGTTAIRMLRKCPCPVLILKPDHPCRCERVVAAVSGIAEDELHTDLNQRIVRLATEAAANGAADIVTAWSIYGESILRSHMKPEEFDELVARTRFESERKLDNLLKAVDLVVGGANVHVLPGEPGVIIPQFVREHDADLLVMGTVGRSGIAGLLTGNIAEQVLDRVDCSVLAVKPEGFVSPIRL